jgi:hypothetical protein
MPPARVWLSLALLLTPANALRAAAPPLKAVPPTVQTAIDRAVPLLIQGARGHIDRRTCFACHNQAIPMLALTTARDRGFSIPDPDLQEQLRFIAAFLDKNRDNYQKGSGTGGQADTAGYALITLEWGGWKADATTAAVAEYLLLFKKESDHWTTSGNRPPSEASPFTTTYLALRALRKWGTPSQQDRIAKRIETARAWLRKTPTRDTEDRVFRLLALHEVGMKGKELQAAVVDLTRTQRANGGWGQLDRLDSDAYATGSVLVALHRAGGMKTTHQAYQRGVAFLLRTQFSDGSWLVRTRSRPFQTYYESGFPHGKDQFISMAATSWAITALALAAPELPRDRRMTTAVSRTR